MYETLREYGVEQLKACDELEQASQWRNEYLARKNAAKVPNASPPPVKTTCLQELTGRELEILRQVATGLTDKEIADRLVISHRTVHTHLTSIYSKLAISSRSAATRIAFENNLL
jgi:DNA-binding NarL/FixJ family response regulator